MASSLTQKIEIAQLKDELIEAQQFIVQLQANYAEKCSEAEILRVECKQIHIIMEQQRAELHSMISQLQSQLSTKEQECAAALSDIKAKHMEVALLQEQLKVTQTSYITKIDELMSKIADYERQVHLLQEHQQQSESRANLEERCGGTEKGPSANDHHYGLSTHELKEDLLVLNTLNKELEAKLRIKSEEAAELSQQVQKLNCEKSQLVIEKDLRENFYSEKIETLKKTNDVVNSEKSKLQEMYNKVMAEYYSMSLNYNIMLEKNREKEKPSSKAVTILRQVCVHNSNKTSQPHATYGRVDNIPQSNHNVYSEPEDQPVPPSLPNVDLIKFGEINVDVIKPRGIKVRTQAGMSFVPETKKLLQIKKAGFEKIPSGPSL